MKSADAPQTLPPSTAPREHTDTPESTRQSPKRFPWQEAGLWGLWDPDSVFSETPRHLLRALSGFPEDGGVS